MLGVAPTTIDVYGAVSTECAEEMAKGALAHASVDLAVSITGIAGPTGAVPGKPIGLFYFCAASRSGRVIAHDRRNMARSAAARCVANSFCKPWRCCKNWRKRKSLVHPQEKASLGFCLARIRVRLCCRPPLQATSDTHA